MVKTCGSVQKIVKLRPKIKTSSQVRLRMLGSRVVAGLWEDSRLVLTRKLLKNRLSLREMQM